MLRISAQYQTEKSMNAETHQKAITTNNIPKTYSIRQGTKISNECKKRDSGYEQPSNFSLDNSAVIVYPENHYQCDELSINESITVIRMTMHNFSSLFMDDQYSNIDWQSQLC